MRLSAIGDGGGGVRFLLALLDDVTEQRRLADELRRSRDDLKLALDAGGAGIWAWVVGTAEVVWSDELERIHGLGLGEFGGRFEDALAPVHPDDVEHI